MGVLKQKCVPSYELFLNGSNFSTIYFNMTYESYLKEIDNESMSREKISWNLKIFYENQKITNYWLK